MKTWRWVQVESTKGEVPIPRSGHSMQVFQNYLIIHGGLFESMKELNDLWAFDVDSLEFICVYKQEWNLENNKGMSSDLRTVSHSQIDR